jgi:hypothetical protein
MSGMMFPIKPMNIWDFLTGFTIMISAFALGNLIFILIGKVPKFPHIFHRFIYIKIPWELKRRQVINRRLCTKCGKVFIKKSFSMKWQEARTWTQEEVTAYLCLEPVYPTTKCSIPDNIGCHAFSNGDCMNGRGFCKDQVIVPKKGVVV